MVAARKSPASQVPSDAVPRTWVDHAPRAAQPYLRLMRLDRPIGTWLLFLPCIFGLALGEASQARLFGSGNDFPYSVLFAIGSITMRGAGCTYNDIVDRHIDAAVARTRGRPLPSGAISVTAAWVFLMAQCAVGLAILLQFNWRTIALGTASLILIAIYPFMKRITWWPQAWLGLTFNWGALLGYSAVAAGVGVITLLLYAGCFFWTMGYDTIYALQDKDDDALIGIKSTARLFGERSRPWIAGFYATAIVLFCACVFATDALPHWTAIFLIPAALHLFWQVKTLGIHSAANCLKLFRSNRDAGLLIAAGLTATAFFVP